MKYFLKLLAYLFVAAGVSAASAGSYDDYFRAIHSENIGGILKLFQRGFDPNTVDPKGRNGLFLALDVDSYKAAETIAEHPAFDIEKPNAAGETPLMVAALRGQAELCRKLLARGAQVNRKGWTALHYAATTDVPELIALLLDRHAYIDAESPNRTTPLMMAARYGSYRGFRVLLEAGADPTLQNDQGLSAADFARAADRERVAKEVEQASESFKRLQSRPPAEK